MAHRPGGGNRFTIPINILHSSTDAGDTVPFACLAITAGYYFRLESYDLTLEWNLVAGVTSALAGYKISRVSWPAAITCSGGTAIVPMPHDTLQGATIITNCRQKLDGALTTTNAVFAQFGSLTVPTAPTGAIARFEKTYDDGSGPVFRAGTGIALQMIAAAAAGLTITGSIEVSEQDANDYDLAV